MSDSIITLVYNDRPPATDVHLLREGSISYFMIDNHIALESAIAEANRSTVCVRRHDFNLVRTYDLYFADRDDDDDDDENGRLICQRSTVI